MRVNNQMNTLLAALNGLPEADKVAEQSRQMAKLVPFLHTAGVVFEELTQERVRVRTDNSPTLHNHIGGIHACVMALLAETATGFVSILNTPDDKIILLKSMNLRYTRRSVGIVRAEADLSAARAALLQAEERGSLPIRCRLWDESGEAPVEADVVWAWLPKAVLNKD